MGIFTPVLSKRDRKTPIDITTLVMPPVLTQLFDTIVQVGAHTEAY